MNLVYIVPVLALGMLVGFVRPGQFTQIFGHATLWIFLPALIFDAAWELHLDSARLYWKPIALLAFPGVALTAAVIAAAAHYGAGLPLGVALLLGAILSATDPIAVVALFRKIVIPRGLLTIVEGESLLNDAVAVVFYRALLALVGGAALVASSGAAVFAALLGIAAGLAIGLVIAFLVAGALRRSGNVPIQAVATFAGAYGGYYVAEHFGWSGIFAVITFGVALRAFEERRISPEAVRAVSRAWAWLLVAANALLFFLIGTSLDITRIMREPRLILVVLAGVLTARFCIIYGLLLPAAKPRLSHGWLAVIRLAGVRGALALALAVGTPPNLAYRGELIDATFCVVIVTIVAGTLTLGNLVRRLNLSAGQQLLVERAQQDLR